MYLRRDSGAARPFDRQAHHPGIDKRALECAVIPALGMHESSSSERLYTRQSTRSRSKSKLALPKTIRFCSFKQFTCASTWPLLHSEENAALTAA